MLKWRLERGTAAQASFIDARDTTHLKVRWMVDRGPSDPVSTHPEMLRTCKYKTHSVVPALPVAFIALVFIASMKIPRKC